MDMRRLAVGGFRRRLVVVFVGLFAVVQLVSFALVVASVRASARHQVDEELRQAGRLFTRQLASRTEHLLAATRLVSGDFALKATAATADHATTASVLENHRRRVGADALMLISLDGTVVVDTRHPGRHGTPFPLPALLEQAEARGESAGLSPLDGQLYRLAVVPLLAPEPIAWLAAGYAIGDRTAAELRQVTGLHISFLRPVAAGFAVEGSTLDAPQRAALAERFPTARHAGVVALGSGGPHVLRAEPVGDDVLVVLQRPLAEALAPWNRLLGLLLGVSVVGAGLAAAGAVVVARRVSRPVLALAHAARRVAAGDFAAEVAVGQDDELGRLAATFNEMVRGLRDRERVRAELERAERLKRFFSPALAEALSRGDDTVLASHRREVTVVFCDLRGFTAFAETAEPEEVMRLLGQYHAAVGPLIFRYEGTLERFTGDGLMVFFNDPLPQPDPAARAVRLALAMREAVEPLLGAWRSRGHRLGFGIGVAMGYATLGRIGFEGRFDYAAIGTVTNLAARLCQEAADGQILISQRVHAEVEALVETEPLGPLTLRGFARPQPVYNVLGVRPGPRDAQPAGEPSAVDPGPGSPGATGHGP
ncbi:MAG TPA: adenylate/guanylate cyclase domain-containing protein [Calidithermus sp.]|nr:adenylate/guanylate cyclase domain-containing protein [Calidithermus sp.]